MVRWMCGMKLQDRVPSKGLRERLICGKMADWIQMSFGVVIGSVEREVGGDH